MSSEAFESPERADFSVENQSFLFGEHLARYQFSAQYVRGKRVVDVAVGTGYGAALLAQAGASHVVGIDYDQKTIDSNKRLLSAQGIEFHQGDCEKYDISVHNPDVIVSFETLEHLKHPKEFLGRVRDALKPDGVFFVSCPNSVGSKRRTESVGRAGAIKSADRGGADRTDAAHQDAAEQGFEGAAATNTFTASQRSAIA